METITSSDGTPIAFERTGSGTPLVLVHGTAADHTRWELFGVRSAFAEHHTVYAMDRRGRGESGDAVEYGLARESEDVAAVVDAVGESAVLVGHSYGALCSLEAALRTDHLRGLVLYEPPFPVDDHQSFDPALLEEMTALVDDGEDEEALATFLRRVAGLTAEELDALREAPNWPERVAAVDTVLRECRSPAEYRFDPRRFESLTVPTLLLAGSESAPFLRAATEALRGVLPDNRLVVFEGHGHVAMNTAPEEFVREVLAFTRGLE